MGGRVVEEGVVRRRLWTPGSQQLLYLPNGTAVDALNPLTDEVQPGRVIKKMKNSWSLEGEYIIEFLNGTRNIVGRSNIFSQHYMETTIRQESFSIDFYGVWEETSDVAPIFISTADASAPAPLT